MLILGVFIISSCASNPESEEGAYSERNIKATIAAGIAATQTAMPTETPEPTNTPSPTPTEVPTETPTEIPPTETAEPEAETDSGSFVITELEDGSRLFEVPAHNFSIEFSDHYEAVDPSDSEFFQEAIEDTLAQNAFSNEQMTALVTAGIKLYAVNMSPNSLTAAVPASINILTQELPLGFSLEEFTTINQVQIGDFVSLTSDVNVNYLQLGQTPASTISYTASIINLNGKPIEVANTQYLIIDPENGKLAYVITVSMLLDLLDEFGTDMLETAETFRLLSDQ